MTATDAGPRDLEPLVDRYCEAWSAPDAVDRERLLHTVLAPDATYCDPSTPAALSLPELLSRIARVHAGRPGARVIRTSAVDAHHGFARFHWCVLMPDGTRLPESLDIVEFTPDHRRLVRIVGFFGPLAGQP